MLHYLIWAMPMRKRTVTRNQEFIMREGKSIDNYRSTRGGTIFAKCTLRIICYVLFLLTQRVDQDCVGVYCILALTWQFVDQPPLALSLRTVTWLPILRAWLSQGVKLSGVEVIYMIVVLYHVLLDIFARYGCLRSINTRALSLVSLCIPGAWLSKNSI